MWQKSRELISIDSHFVKVGMGPGSAAHRGPSLNVRLQHIGRAALRPGHEALRDCLLSNCLSRLEAKEYRPLFRLRARGSPSFLSSSVSLTSRGMARRQGARPGSPGRRWHGLRPGPGRETSRPAPCGAPSRHLRLTPQSAIGPHQELCVPGGFLPRPPVGQACVNARPQVAAPVPRLANASGRRPRLWTGMSYT
jgi:hypothetical protein